MQIDQGNDTLDTPNIVDPALPLLSILFNRHIRSCRKRRYHCIRRPHQDSLNNDNNGIPILADIPGVGRLFQHRVSNREKRVLMVFIRLVFYVMNAITFRLVVEKYNELRKYQLQWLRTQEPYHPRDKGTRCYPIRLFHITKTFHSFCSGIGK